MCKPDCGCQRISPRINLAQSEYRYETFMGRQHIVVPVILAKSDVVMNASVLPEDEFNPESWNGVPVTLGHPVDESGSYVSANLPRVLEAWHVGRIFNAEVKDTSLRGEAWIDVELAANLVDLITQSEELDVSTGYFCDHEPKKGVMNGREFEYIARNVRPDHLALLPGDVGACSWADGCGVRSNKRKQEMSKPDVNANEPAVVTPTMITVEEANKLVANAVSEALKTHKAELSEEDKQAIVEANKLRAERKASLVERVTANSTITKEQAEAMDMATLEVVANGLPEAQPDFSGRIVGNRAPAEDPVAKDMAPPSVIGLFRNRK